ncbi:MAG: hypothetical protein IT200_14425 [Thermoleophilia bacterium]|nr:hypothetical protein [Thermoleophilia bacterium]
MSMAGAAGPPYAKGILEALSAARAGRAMKVLRGYLDMEAKPPRLYAGLDLSVYVTLDEIIAIEPGPDPLDPTLVWVPQAVELEVEVLGQDLYGALITGSPELLFGLGSCEPVTMQAYACPRPKVTSHTIGWCAED